MNEIEKIVEDKESYKNNLKKLRNKYLVSIYFGLSSGKSLKDIQSELYNLTINSKTKSKNLYNAAIKVLNSASKKLPKKSDDIILSAKRNYQVGNNALTIPLALSYFVYDIMFKNVKSLEKLNTVIKNDSNDKEAKEKESYLEQELASNRERTIPKIFYLISKHDDSAEDHKEYQGKIYVDEKYKEILKSTYVINEIENFIRLKNIQTFQYITGKPVWLITRPNCRHYFKAIETMDVLNKNLTTLLKQNKMTARVGKRNYLQTISHSTNKKWYKARNVELLIKQYEERLQLLRELDAKKSNNLVKNAIHKTKVLIGKWKDYYKKLK